LASQFRSRGKLPDSRGAGAFAQFGEIVYIATGFVAAVTGRKQIAAASGNPHRAEPASFALGQAR